MVRRDVVMDWQRDGRTQYIHEIEESLSLTNQHFNCCGFNKWKIIKNYKRTIQEGQTITFVRIAAGDLSVGC